MLKEFTINYFNSIKQQNMHLHQTIRIFCRIKPTNAKTGLYEVTLTRQNAPHVTFYIPRSESDGLVNNRREAYPFKFNKVFDQQTSQDEVFERVAKEVIDNVLAGYNGTIFAYGQTGSGKTFTITGGAERYADRGIIPRSLSYVFLHQENHPENVYTTQVSYMEIYNGHGYDLLDPKHEASKLEDLPKVFLQEDSERNIHLRNLSIHTANNEEEALN
ncbi:LOW QUALITY PROTEIN: kinesin-like protein KIF6, partial [Corticium candelabrum]|uniref:LOW QUALITY PROTEIN: kinesin-like protein KIF6 n=1 Tax=Corticium candelabrum TaxID=121492 RepID=UPI002E276917